MRAAEPAKGTAVPAGGAGQVGHQPPTPAAPNQPPAPAAANDAGTKGGTANNAPGARGERDRNGKSDNDADRRRERRVRIVYIPGYGYANWLADYSTPYWNTSGTWYTGEDFPQGQQYPSNDNSAAPRPSNRPQEEAAQAEMTSARARLAKEFESNEEVRDALHDVQEAQRAYDAAVAKASKDLKNDPVYEKAEAEKQKAARKVEAVQAADRQAAGATATQPAPISPEVVRAAQQKLNAASQESAIAADRAQAHPAVVAAREKLEAAADRLNAMKGKFDAALQGDPQWQTAKQKLDAARATPQ
jgi:hypothetical protein